jgi:Chaperone of endosialidase
MKRKTSLIRNLMNRLSRHCGSVAALLIALALAWFGLAPQARAVCQDACLTNNNTVQGEDALFSLATGVNNTAIGFKALFSDTDGTDNTAIGTEALFSNTTGNYNTANSDFSLYYNTTGNYNTATGPFALYYNTHGNSNTANGYRALQNSTGDSNTATGYRALGSNTIGNNNIALGFQAGLNLTTGSSNIDIGNRGVAGEANTIRIGTVGTQTNTFVAGISGVTVAGGVAVVIDANGQLGTSTSSARYKEAVKPMDKASETIFALKPVTFRYKHDLDPDAIPQFGLVAEDVEKVNPDLVARDDEGKPYTVRYEAVNAMLLNEFLKAHRRMEEQEATIAKQQNQIDALTSGLQKVSAQLELSKPATQTALNQ